MAGLYAEGRVETGTTQVLTVPEAAVVRAGDATHVWRVKDGRRCRKCRVQLGERDARRGEFPVVSGLAAGDRILRAPSGTLVDGQKVEFAVTTAPGGGASGLPAVAKP